MESQIKAYQQYLSLEVESIKSEMNKATGVKDVKNLKTRIDLLSRYHNQRLDNFKHERWVHLMIMLFFGILLVALLFMAALVIPGILEATPNALGGILFYLLTSIVLVVECFYIKHYFFLENSIQGLYIVEKDIYSLLKSVNLFKESGGETIQITATRPTRRTS